ncbi:MAG TPA: hypothetical protein V6D17_13850 [Candidatus Obscuribacterales bacterium]
MESSFSFSESEGKDPSSGGPSESKASHEGRLSTMQNVIETFRYVQAISKDKSLTVRARDKLTNRLVIIALLVGILFIGLPYIGLHQYSTIFWLVANCIFMASLVVFVSDRFGILRTLQPRYALIAWQLLFGTAVLSFMLAMTIVLVMIQIATRLFSNAG